MSLIIRIDVDRPYGRRPLARHLLSRFSSDYFLPRIEAAGYLAELATMLEWLNAAGAPAYAFCRRCTLPSARITALLEAGGHQLGLHLEDSRSEATFRGEVNLLEQATGRKVTAVSKHGSGADKFGWHHHAPYEPEKYVAWMKACSMRLFLGNLEDPRMTPVESEGLLSFPSAFWLEPHWRDTAAFSLDWLIENAQARDIVLLVHPENVLADPDLVSSFQRLIHAVPSTVQPRIIA